MKVTEIERILGIVRATGREAAGFAFQGFRKRPLVEHKGAVDLVTNYDRDTETLLRERLAPLGFAVVGEEQGGTVPAGEPTFFVDPIDGTTNFVHGHPMWCVSIGLVVDAQPLLGVVVAPAMGLEWYGYANESGARHAVRRSRSAGSEIEEEEICVVSSMSRFEDSLLATGFPYDRSTSSDNNFDAFVNIKRKCQAVRRCGSAALDLCLVSDGTYEGYWERKLRPWDIAAGIALVRAAGGRVSEYDGGTDYIASGHVVATNGLIHDTLCRHLGSLGEET